MGEGKGEGHFGLGALFDRIRDGVLVAEAPAGRVVLANRPARRIFGPGARRMKLADLLPGAAVVGAATEITAHHADGSEATVEVELWPLPTDPGYVVAIVRDITTQRTLEHERGAFLAAVSHDLKSPLAAISGQAQLLRRRVAQLEAPDSPQMTTRLTRIDETTQRMARLIDDLIDLARLQMGRSLELNLAPTDLGELTRAVAADVGKSSSRHHLQVEADTGPVGQWDASRLGRVIENLLLNAIKHSPGGGEIDVRVSSEDDRAAVAVRDPGQGIAADELPRIFEPTPGMRRIRRDGIGLAGSKRIVEQHGGTIVVQNRPGGGCVFTVWLPLTSDE